MIDHAGSEQQNQKTTTDLICCLMILRNTRDTADVIRRGECEERDMVIQTDRLTVDQ